MNIKVIGLSLGIHAILLFGLHRVQVRTPLPQATPVPIRVAAFELIHEVQVKPPPQAPVVPPELPPRSSLPKPAEAVTHEAQAKAPKPQPEKSKPSKSKTKVPLNPSRSRPEVPKDSSLKKAVVKLNTVLSNKTGASNGQRDNGASGSGRPGLASANAVAKTSFSNKTKTGPCREKASQPRPIQKTAIPYPKRAREQGVQGQLVLRLWIDERGRVGRVKVLRSLSAHMDSQAIEAVRSWKFRPARACGKAVSGQFTLARRFELGG